MRPQRCQKRTASAARHGGPTVRHGCIQPSRPRLPARRCGGMSPTNQAPSARQRSHVRRTANNHSEHHPRTRVPSVFINTIRTSEDRQCAGSRHKIHAPKRVWAAAWRLHRTWAVFHAEPVEVQLLGTLPQKAASEKRGGFTWCMQSRPLPAGSCMRPADTQGDILPAPEPRAPGSRTGPTTRLDPTPTLGPLVRARWPVVCGSTSQRSRPEPSTARTFGRPDLRPPRKTNTPPHRKDEPPTMSCQQRPAHTRAVCPPTNQAPSSTCR
ncbi:hypothetical protein M2368_003428 [Arthrobacter sp. JUb119]|nr:hypothetical protein [Arthrobacter sp. JUb119]TDU22490.1 hypothetical protein EDF61_10920 [Arthrobacter sp. JUb115]